MKIQIESTKQIITTVDGLVCRVWNGVTEGGVPCLVMVRRIAVEEGHDTDEFERDLADDGSGPVHLMREVGR